MDEAAEALIEYDIFRSVSLEILTTEDHRIKSIGDVFANDTERAILCKVCEGLETALAISKDLQFDLGLVVRYLQRLVEVGLVKVERVSISQKGRPMKVYTPTKMAIIIIPSTLMKRFGEKAVIRSLVNALLPKLITVITFTFTTVLTFDLLSSLLPITGFSQIEPGTPLSYLDVVPTVILSTVVGGILTLLVQRRIRRK